MELTRKELDDIVAYHTTCGDKKGYTIFLDGHQFVSSKRKRVFAKRSHAMSSLRASIEWTIRGFVRRHLNELGVDPREIYKHDDFVHAWDNFVRQATELGFLQIVELE